MTRQLIGRQQLPEGVNKEVVSATWPAASLSFQMGMQGEKGATTA